MVLATNENTKDGNCPKPLKIEEKASSDIYLIAMWLVRGARIKVGAIDRCDPRHVKITVVGPFLQQVEDEWLDPSNEFKKYANFIKDVKSIVHP